MCRYHWWSARLRCVCFEMFLSPAVARCPFLSCTGSPQSMWGEQRMPSSQRPTTASTSSSKSLLSTWVFLKKRPMTLEVWCDERTFPTQLKVTKEWILMSLLESVWRCVVMFWEWAELGGGGHCASAAVTGPFRADLRWQQRHVTSHHLCFDTRLPAPSALSLHLPLPWLQWFQRGRRTVAPSLSASPFTTLRKRAKRCYPRVVTF